MSSDRNEKEPPPRRDRVIRAAALAAYEICTNCSRYNPKHLGTYLSCVFNMLFAIIRTGAPRDVPVPKEVNRSAVSAAEKKFWDLFNEKLRRLEGNATRRHRPQQPKLVSEAMSMLPSARGGKGPQKFEEFRKKVPKRFQAILELVSHGVELLVLRNHSRSIRNPRKR